MTNELTIPQILAIAAALGTSAPSQPCSGLGGTTYKIVVLDRGFVVHGKVRKEGAYIIIDDCNCIRQWGTPAQEKDSGLGLLARKGPTGSTKLDAQGTTRVHELQVVQFIDCPKDGPWVA